VRGARNAGVVIANRLFTAPLQFLIVEGESVLHNSTQVVFDAELILRRRRHDSGPRMMPSSSMSYWWSRRPRGASVVAVPVAARATTSMAGLNRRLVTLDETKRLVAREDEFNRAHHDASKRIHARCVQSGGGGGVASHLGQA